MNSKILIAVSKNIRLIIADTTKISKQAIKYSEYDEMFLTSEIALLNIASIMSMGIKNEKGKIVLILKSDGLLGNAKAIAKYNGKVMANCLIDNDKFNEINSVKNLEEFTSLYKIGKGNLLVEVDLGMKNPYLTNLLVNENESIEEIIEKYYKNSEQLDTIIRTAFKYKDEKLETTASLMIQALPNANKDIFEKYKKKLKEIYSLSVLLEHDFSLEKIASLIFDRIEEFKILEEKELKFECECSEKYFKELVLLNLSKNEIIEILKEKKYIETVCGFCNRVYRFRDFK